MLRSTAIVYTAREMTRTSQNQRGDILDLLHRHPLAPGQDRFKQFPTPGPEGLDLFQGLPEGNGNRSN